MHQQIDVLISYTSLGGIAAKIIQSRVFNTIGSDWSRNAYIQIPWEQITILAYSG